MKNLINKMKNRSSKGLMRRLITKDILRLLLMMMLPMLTVSSTEASASVVLKLGDILVAEPATASISVVDPTTGVRTVISEGGLLLPAHMAIGVALGLDGYIIVAHRLTGLIRVNPLTGEQSVLSQGEQFRDPWAIAINRNTGDIYVADSGYDNDRPEINEAGKIIRVNPVSGAQELIASGSPCNFFPSNAACQNTTSAGSYLAHPYGIAIDYATSPNTIVVADMSSFNGKGAIVRIQPVPNGTQTLLWGPAAAVPAPQVAQVSPLGCPMGITVEPSGNILTTTFTYPVPPSPSLPPPAGTFYGCAPPGIFRVDLVNNVQEVVNANGPQWQANHAYAIDNVIATSSPGHVQRVVTAGVSQGVTPDWNSTLGGLTPDGSVVWQNIGPGANWQIPFGLDTEPASTPSDALRYNIIVGDEGYSMLFRLDEDGNFLSPVPFATGLGNVTSINVIKLTPSSFSGTESPLSENGVWDSPGAWVDLHKDNGAFATGLNAMARLITPLVASDQYGQITYDQDPGASSWVGVSTRVQGAGNGSGYLAIVYAGEVRLYRTDDSGSLNFTLLAAASANLAAAPRRLRLESQGNTHRVYFNGALLIDHVATGTFYSGGQPAIAASVFGGPQVKILSFEGGNLSAGSSDTMPPVRSNGSPTGTLAAGTTQATLSLSTNEAAVCRYSTIAGVAYNAMTGIFTTTGSTTHANLVTGLVNGVSYFYFVRCVNAIGNENLDDFTISFSVATSSAAPSSFSGTESPLSEGGVWDSPGAWADLQKSNGAYAIGFNAMGRRVTPLVASDQYAQITYDQDPGASSWVGVSTRVQGAGNGSGYLAIVYAGEVQLYRTDDSGSLNFTLLAAASANLAAAPRRLRLESQGNTHRVYFNGALLIDHVATGTVYSGGQPAIAASVFGGPQVKILSFEGGNLSAATSSFSGTESPLSEGGVWDSPGAWADLHKNNGAFALGLNAMGRQVTPLVGSDHYGQITYDQDPGASSWVGVSTRVQGAGNGSGYLAIVYAGEVQLYRTDDSGSLNFTLLAAASANLAAAPRRLRLESLGNTHRVYFNGALLIDHVATGTFYSGGQLAIAASVFGGPQVKILSFEGGNLSAATSSFSGTESPLSEGGVWDSPGAWADLHKNNGAFALGLNAMGRRVTPLVGSDHYAQITYDQDPGASSWVGVSTRVQGAGNGSGYLAIVYAGEVRLYRTDDSGSLNFTMLAAASANLAAAPRRLRLESQGTTHRVYFNGALLIDHVATGTFYSGGQPAIAASVFGGPQVKILSFEGGNLSVGS